MSEFVIRHYVPEKDLKPLARMLTEIEAIDHDGEDTSEESLRTALTWPNYRPDQDVWVVELDGQLVGYCVALEQPSGNCTVYAVVHPSQRHKGLGKQLLNTIIEHAREFDSKNLLVYVNERNAASLRFLQRNGFQPVGSSGMMKAPSKVDTPPFKFPPGFILKPYSEINQPHILLQALNLCYLDMWGHQHHENPTEDELQSPSFLKYFDADDILLLFDEKYAVIGICSVKSEGRKDTDGSLVDLLDAPGLIKEYRARGYQRELVLAAIHHLHRKATRPIRLEFWGEGEQILNTYRELDFEMTNHFIAHHKEIA